MDKEYFINLIKTAGPHMALVMFFVWQGMIREERLNKQYQDLNDYVRTRLEKLVEDNHDVIKENTAVIKSR